MKTIMHFNNIKRTTKDFVQQLLKTTLDSDDDEVDDDNNNDNHHHHHQHHHHHHHHGNFICLGIQLLFTYRQLATGYLKLSDILVDSIYK